MPQQVTKRRIGGTAIKFGAIALVAVALAFIVGLYAVAPQLQRGSERYLPGALAAMPTSLIVVTNPDDTTVTLLVRLANTAAARNTGLSQAGPAVLATTVLLYDQTRERTTATTSYAMTGLRAPLELAVIQADGTVSSVQRVAQDATTAAVAGRHRWVLAAQEGLLSAKGITAGSRLHVDQIRRL